MKRIVGVVVTVVLAGSVVALGGVANAKPLTESQFKKQGNAICKAGNEELDLLFEKYFGDLKEGEEPDLATIDALSAEFIPNIQDQIDAIDALEEPKSLSKPVDKFLTTAQRELDALDADHSLFLEPAGAFPKTSKLAKKVGLKQCADD